MKIRQIETSKNWHGDRELTPLGKVLYNRGITDPEAFFNIGWNSVQNPTALNNINDAFCKVTGHLNAGSNIAILVDSDVDGFTSAAVLHNAIKAHAQHQNWTNTDIKFLFHRGKEHGLSDTTVMKELRDLVKPALLIVPDASGTDEQYKALNDLGIDIVVLDHHDTKERGDGQRTIVVNNQHSPEYVNKALSGVGVVYQFCCLMDNKYGYMYAERWLDLVALGLVADVMDLRSPETRFLVQVGLANPQSQFVLQCLETYDYQMKGQLSPFTVAFYIAPMVNAVNRIGTQEEKEIIFKAMLDGVGNAPIPSGKRGAKGEMVPLVMEALRQGANAKSRQTRRQEKLSGLIDAVIDEEGLLQNKVIIVTIDDFDDDQRALSGLIANKLIEAYQRPVMLLFWNEEKEEYHGSARAPSDVEAFANFRQQCVDSGLFLYAAGHEQAHGVGVAADKVDEIQEHFNSAYTGLDVEPTYNCDFIFEASDPELDDVILEIGEHTAIWGTGIKEPLIAIRNVQITKSNTVLFTRGRTPTLKITLPGGASCIRFNSSQEEFDSIVLPYEGGVEQGYTATIVGRANVNEWQGKVTPQLMIVDYHIESSGYVF